MDRVRALGCNGSGREAYLLLVASRLAGLDFFFDLSFLEYFLLCTNIRSAANALHAVTAQTYPDSFSFCSLFKMPSTSRRSSSRSSGVTASSLLSIDLRRKANIVSVGVWHTMLYTYQYLLSTAYNMIERPHKLRGNNHRISRAVELLPTGIADSR